MYSYMRDNMRRGRHREDKIVLDEDKYDGFMQNWINMLCTYNHMENLVIGFFRGVMVLIENQIMRAYVRRMSQN